MGWTVVVVCRNNGNFMDLFACMFPDCIKKLFFIFTIQVKTSGKESLGHVAFFLIKKKPTSTSEEHTLKKI